MASNKNRFALTAVAMLLGAGIALSACSSDNKNPAPTLSDDAGSGAKPGSGGAGATGAGGGSSGGASAGGASAGGSANTGGTGNNPDAGDGGGAGGTDGGGSGNPDPTCTPTTTTGFLNAPTTAVDHEYTATLSAIVGGVLPALVPPTH